MSDIFVSNFTVPNSNSANVQYVSRTVHVFGISEIIFLVLTFLGLAYFYWYTDQHKNTCTAWQNDNGHIVNLCMVSKWMFYVGSAIIVVLGVVAILIK